LHFGEIPNLLFDTVNKLDIHETAELISRARAYIGIDAGTLHIAACTETPVVALYTAAKAEFREPRDRTAKHVNIASEIECYGCMLDYPPPYQTYHCKRGDEECTRRFDPEKIVEKLLEIL